MPSARAESPGPVLPALGTTYSVLKTSSALDRASVKFPGGRSVCSSDGLIPMGPWEDSIVRLS